eukprot:3867276-Pyramimonas_sp.AAC.1
MTLYRVLLEVPLAQGALRISTEAPMASRAPQRLQNGATNWGHLGPGVPLATPDGMSWPLALSVGCVRSGRA